MHTRESFIEAQLDTVSITARTLLPLVGADLWFTGEAAPEGTPERQRQRALALLADWNGEMNEHLPEPLIYAAWMRALQDRLIRDELGPLADEFTHVEPLFIERVFRDVDGAAVWCDVRPVGPGGNLHRDRAAGAGRRAGLDRRDLWQRRSKALRWGDAHQATHDHPVLGEVPFCDWFVNIRQSTSGGDNTLHARADLGRRTRRRSTMSTARAIGGSTISPTPTVRSSSPRPGQSGHFLSRHYDDLGELWRRGEYIPMSLDASLARAAAVGVTVLTPKAP